MNKMGLSVVFIISVASILISPFFMPMDYSWITNTISESAAQGLNNAWITRLGFITFGLGVIGLSVYLNNDWPITVRVCHAIFGISMLFVAAFSMRHWDNRVDFDPTENMLHSVFANAMGFAICLGVLFSFFKRGSDSWGKFFDIMVAGSSIIIPILMLYYPNTDGLIQRFMFGVSYFWYLRELMVKRKMV